MNANVFYAMNLHFWSREHKVVKIFFTAIIACLLISLPMQSDYLSFLHTIFTYFLLLATTGYSLVIFSLGTDTDLTGRSSRIPSHYFTLPVSTITLLIWPVFGGAIAMQLNWFAINLFTFKPEGVEVDFWWPALLFMSLMAWLQAFSWRPYRFSGSAAALLCLFIVGFGALSWVIILFQEHTFMIASLLLTQLALAYYLAWDGFKRSRNGYTLEPWAWTKKFPELFFNSNRKFSSSLEAQENMEWRIHFMALPGISLGLGALILFITLMKGHKLFRADTITLQEILSASALPSIFTLLYILIFSFFWASFKNLSWFAYGAYSALRTSYFMPSFISTLPITNQSLIAAKFRAFSKNILLAFGITVVFSLINFSLIYREFGDFIFEQAALFGLAKIITMVIISVALALIYSLATGLSIMWITLMNRKAIQTVIIAFFTLMFMTIFYLLKAQMDIFMTLLPWVLGGLCLIKLGLMAWLLPWLLNKKHYQAKTLLLSVTGWLAMAGFVFWFYLWVMPAQLSSFLVIAILICFTPILGILGAPAALKLNRSQ